MSNILILFLLLINKTNLKLREKNPYDYTTYSSVSKNTDLSEETITSTTADQSAVYITDTITISNSNINKESGDSSKREDSEFYGVNAALLVQGGTLTMNEGTITTKAKGANALVATNEGVVSITGTEITSTGEVSARGLHSTYGGVITAKKLTISTEGQSCATLATDRGEGVISCEECNLTTKGAGSPLIYSTGTIKVEKTEGTAFGAQAVVIEGDNTAHISGNSNLKCTASPNRKEVDQCGVMIYQSFSGDAKKGTGALICQDSSIEILNTKNYYKTAPMFFITNTNANIQLSNCNLIFGSNTFMNIKGTNEWGKQGSNGGIVELSITNEHIVGNIEVDSISSLSIRIIKSTIEGTFNPGNTAKSLNIFLDADSKIILTGNSYSTSIINDLKDGSNLINGSYTWTIGQKTSYSKGITNSNLFILSLILSMLL